jgi:hypothetical protein
MLIFFWVTVVFVHAIVSKYSAGEIDAEAMAKLIFNSAVGESFQAVLGFLYGYRSRSPQRDMPAMKGRYSRIDTCGCRDTMGPARSGMSWG